jgi:hypothetical protein
MSNSAILHRALKKVNGIHVYLDGAFGNFLFGAKFHAARQGLYQWGAARRFQQELITVFSLQSG